MRIRINQTDNGPAGRVAEAEILFEDSDGLLTGLKLIGFAVWSKRTGGMNVTFPARQYSVNGERRSFALLRPIVDMSAQNRIREAIIQAYSLVYAQPDAARNEVVINAAGVAVWP